MQNSDHSQQKSKSLKPKSLKSISRSGNVKTKPGGKNPSSEKLNKEKLNKEKLNAEKFNTKAKYLLSAIDPKLKELVNQAAQCYVKDRYQEAVSILKKTVKMRPDYADARELLGLCYYRLDEYQSALGELEYFTNLTKDYEQLPVIADCYRASGNYKKVFSIWNMIKAKKLPRSIFGEARLVVAGAYKDLGEVNKAYDLMRSCGTDTKQPSFLKLREWYLLADILEEMGDFPNARRLFKKVAEFDPELADVAQRALID
jgi:tetratricopeptide (TPR) repeat protein